jgi:hypothetical protein
VLRGIAQSLIYNNKSMNNICPPRVGGEQNSLQGDIP